MSSGICYKNFKWVLRLCHFPLLIFYFPPLFSDVDYQVNQTYAFSLFPENATLSVPVTVFDDQIVEITEQFLMTVSVANALATTGDNRTATVFIVDSNGEWNHLEDCISY